MNLEQVASLTKLEIRTEPHWTLNESEFSTRIFLLGESILLISTSGRIDTAEIHQRIKLLETVIAELGLAMNECIVIEDTTEVSELTLSARQIFGKWLIDQVEHFKLLIFNNPDTKVETSIRFRMSLQPSFGKWVWIAKGLEEALELTEQCSKGVSPLEVVSEEATVPSESNKKLTNLLGYIGNLVWLGNMDLQLPEELGEDDSWTDLYAAMKVLREDIKQMLLNKNREVDELGERVRDRTSDLEAALRKSRTAEEQQYATNLDLIQLRKYSETKLKEAEALLYGVKVLNSSLDSGDPIEGLMTIMKEFLHYEHIFLLFLDDDGKCTTNFHSDEMFIELEWTQGEFFKRLEEGRAIAVFDTSLIPEWQGQPAELLSTCVSALHIPLGLSHRTGILICTGSKHGSFSREDADFAQNLSVLAAQAIRNADMLKELRSARTYLEEKVKERTREVRSLAQFATDNPNPMMRISGDGILLYANKASSDILDDWKTEAEKPVPEFMKYLINRTIDVNEVSVTELNYGDKTVQLTLAPVPIDNYVSVYGTDISERVNAQAALEHERGVLEIRVLERTEELSTANEQLFNAMETKDKFLARMSHELRTPLNAIMGFSESLQHDVYGPLTDRQTPIIKKIATSGKDLLALINDVLDFSKMQTDKFSLLKSAFFLAKTAESSLHLVQHIVEKKEQTLSLDVDETIRVVADERRVKQIIVNLLSNAVKFTEEKGEISLEIKGDRSEEMVYITVRDTGIGISEDDMDILFVPFEQIDSSISRKYEGTGLGLDISKRLAELHGGDITVESVVGEGSAFTLNLPWEEPEDEPEETEEEIKETITPDPDSLHVLLVEDNEDNIQTIKDYLESTGIRVSVTTNGIKALKVLDSVIPDLILMDVFMPEMDGLEATRIIREERGLTSLPIIALTALAMDSDMEKCLEAGATEYFTKPVRFGKLVEAIHRLCNK